MGGAIPSDWYIVARDEDLWHAYFFWFMEEFENCTVGMANNPKEMILVVEGDSVKVCKVTFLC